MSFRGRGGGRGGFSGGRGKFQRPQGPPDFVEGLFLFYFSSDHFSRLIVNFLICFCLGVGHFIHPCKEQAIIKLSNATKVPKFNAPVYTVSKQQLGKVDEVFGPINEIVSS